MKQIIFIISVLSLFSIVGCGGGGGGSSATQQTHNAAPFSVLSSIPAQNASGVATAGFSMTVTFSNPIDASVAYLDLNAQTTDTVISLSSKNHGFQPISINVSGATLTVKLNNSGMTLWPSDIYTLSIQKTLTDVNGQTLQVPTNQNAYTIMFSTQAASSGTGSGSGSGTGSGSGSGSGTGSGSGSGSSGSGSGSGSSGGGTGGGSGSGSGGGGSPSGMVTLNFQLENTLSNNQTIDSVTYSFGTQTQASNGIVSPEANYSVQNNTVVPATQTMPVIPVGDFSNQPFTYQVYYPFQSGTTYYFAMKACTTDSSGNPNCSPYSNEASASF